MCKREEGQDGVYKRVRDRFFSGQMGNFNKEFLIKGGSSTFDDVGWNHSTLGPLVLDPLAGLGRTEVRVQKKVCGTLVLVPV